jgi:hypothetical protein
VSLAAQVKTGNFTTSLSGTIAPGYTATYGNQTPSSHAWALGGTGNLTGSYYSPNFLSFDAGYYLNQSRANSNFQSITNASGFNFASSIFAGSHFPGAISYTKAYDSEGNYAIPGVANFVTHGNSDTFGINWSELLPDKPTFSAGFDMGNSEYTVYGTKDTGSNHFRSVNLHSSYHLAGYSLGAFYTLGNSNADIPQVLVSSGAQVHNNSHSYGFNVSHVLPLQGSLSGAYTRSQFDTDYLGNKTNGTIDLLNAIAVLHPARKLALTGTASYSDNLSGQVVEALTGVASSAHAASTGSIFDSSQSSNSLDLMAVASYTPAENAQLAISAERRSQAFLGNSYAVNSYSLTGAYTRRFFEGNLNSSGTMTANTMDRGGEDTLGFTLNETYNTVIHRWHLNGNFSYAQNVQTLLVTYMNSFYNYSGSARRAWGRLSFSASAAASHTAITDQRGTSNASQSYSTSLGYDKWITASGGFSKGSGQGLITGSGIAPVPVPQPVVPSSLISMYGGEGYSFSVASTPAKRLIMQASWSRSFSNTANTDISGNVISSSNHNGQFNTLVQYQLRKLSVNAGYARLEQGFSGSPLPAQTVSSYFMGASRWFKFF